MNGLDLKEMEASKMLDVLHYMFEEDNFFTSVEAVESRDNVRIHFYKNFYDVDYAYAMKRDANQQFANGGVEGIDEPLTPMDPSQRSQAVKPYIPPTPVNGALDKPFGDVLDGPVLRDL